MSLNLTIFFQIINLIFTIFFLKRYLFTFLLDQLAEEDTRFTALQNVSVAVKSEIQQVLQTQKHDKNIVVEQLADDFAQTSILQKKPILNHNSDDTSIKIIIDSLSKDKLAFDQVEQTILMLTRVWGQK